jgi:hypothetical protein
MDALLELMPRRCSTARLLLASAQHYINIASGKAKNRDFGRGCAAERSLKIGPIRRAMV